MEKIPLEKEIMAIGGVEYWLGNLLKVALQSLNVVIGQGAAAIKEPDFQILDFLEKFPAQVGLLGIQFIWTRDAEMALRKSRIDKVKNFILISKTRKTFDILHSIRFQLDLDCNNNILEINKSI